MVGFFLYNEVVTKFKKWGIFEMFGVLLAVLVVLWASLSLAFGVEDDLRVSEIIDGDTVVLSDGRVIRLLGFNAPEKSDSLFQKSVVMLEALTKNKTIWLEKDRYEKDRYGRDLVWLWINCEREPDFLAADYMVKSKNQSKEGIMGNPVGCKQGMMINEQMVKLGLGKVYFLEKKGDMKYEERLYLLEQEMGAKIGSETNQMTVKLPQGGEGLGEVVVPALGGTKYLGYSLKFPVKWKPLFNSGKMVLEYGAYKLIIEQDKNSRSVGCDFKDSESKIFPKLDLKDKLYKKILGENYSWRYYQGQTSEVTREYDLCVSSENGFETGSPVGFIKMITPMEIDQVVFDQMKKMVAGMRSI